MDQIKYRYKLSLFDVVILLVASINNFLIAINISQISRMSSLNVAEQNDHLMAQINESMKCLHDLACKISPTTSELVRQISKLLYLEMSQCLQSADIDTDKIFPWKYQIKNHSYSPICSKRMHESLDKTVFSCFDCRQSDNSILCYECFSQSNHDGHKYIKYQTVGGVCDCGDDNAWSKDGFCAKHKSEIKIDVEEGLRNIFYAEMKFAYLLYFWLIDQLEKGRNIGNIKQLYGMILLDFSANLVSEEFQLKYLLSQVYLSKFTEPVQFSKKNMNIIQRFFDFDEMPQISCFNKVAIQLFPIEQFIIAFLQQYFAKTYRNEIYLDHPIKELNYQYMGRPKVVSELIVAGKLKPLQLSVQQDIQTPQLVISLYKKWINDLTYLLKNKFSAVYFKIHFERVNICDMVFYRKYTEINAKKQKIGERVILDDYFLKIYAEILKVLKNQKAILRKIMKELMDFIKNNQTITYSLAHERAFAMTAIAYLQGSMDELQQKQTKKELIKFLNIDRQNFGINYFVQKQIQKYLRAIATSQQYLQKQQIQQDNFCENFNSNYPQKYLLESLDRVYIKILVRLYDGQFSFCKTIEALSHKFFMMSIPRLNFYLLQTYISIISTEIDEIVVNDAIDAVCDQKFFHFLKRFWKSYPMLSPKQLKAIAKRIINNDKLIEEFLMKQVKVQKGKLVTTIQQRPLQTYIYYKYLKKIQIDAFKAVPTYYEKIPKIHYFKNRSIYSEATPTIIVKILPKIQKLSEDLSLFLLQIANCYSETKFEGCLQAFSQVMELNKQPVIRRELIDQATLIFHPKNQLKESEIKQSQEDSAKKKDAFLKKRKEKEEIMKKKQLELLKNYENVDEKQTLETCIYCKQNDNSTLYFATYCNLTNIYEKRCLRIQTQHLFFQSCGHKIHKNCYQKYLSQVQEFNSCFLCKRDVNMLVPTFRKDLPDNQQKQLSQQFIQIIYPILIKQYDDNQDLVNKFYSQRHKESILAILVQSFVREIALRGIYDLNSFKKQLFSIYSTIFDILMGFNESQIKKILDQMLISSKKIEHQSQFKEIQLALLFLLRENLLKTPHFEQLKSIKYQKALNLFQNIIRLFQNKGEGSYKLIELQLANQHPIINSLPEKLIELLPVKPQCGICHKFQNRLLTCLLCDWVACDEHKNGRNDHAQKEHAEGSIFVYMQSGEVLYSLGGLSAVYDSIYCNFFGEPANNEQTDLDKETLLKYQLDQEDYNNLKISVIKHMIHDKKSQ